MLKFNRILLLNFILGLLVFALGVRAQDNPGVALAAVQNGQLTLFGLGDTPLPINIPPNRGIFSIAWGPGGSKLAYIMNDEQFHAYLYVVDVTTGTDPMMLETGTLEIGFPITFTPDNRIIYIAQGELPQDAAAPYRSQVNQIDPEAGAQPESLGSFAFMAGCGGGSLLPADWQYWGEAGFGGSAMILQMTDYGLLHSQSCGGSGLALLNLETGEDQPLGSEDIPPDSQGLGRAALSFDGKTLAAVKTIYAEPELQRSLLLVDLSTGAVTDVITAAPPDQLAWGYDGVLFYSVRQVQGNLVDTLTDAQKQTLDTVMSGMSQNELSGFLSSIHRWNPATGEDTMVYSADAYAIGRMAATPDGQHLIASQVANLNAWLTAIGDGTLDPNSDMEGDQQRALVPVTLYQIPLITREAPLVIGENLSQFVLRTSRQ